MPKTIKTVSEFQRSTKPTFDQIANSPDPVLVMNRSKKVGVFLSPQVYEQFIEEFEDYRDAEILDKATKAKDIKFDTLEEVEALLDNV